MLCDDRPSITNIEVLSRSEARSDHRIARATVELDMPRMKKHRALANKGRIPKSINIQAMRTDRQQNQCPLRMCLAGLLFEECYGYPLSCRAQFRANTPRLPVAFPPCRVAELFIAPRRNISVGYDAVKKCEPLLLLWHHGKARTKKIKLIKLICLKNLKQWKW